MAKTKEVDQLPKYKNPPVVELVCGVLFRPLSSFLVPHFGLLSERFREEYPLFREVPPIMPIVERFEESPAVSSEGSADISRLFPRIWFQSKDSTGVIQVQRDRFLHNWRRAAEGDEYPHYVNVVQQFRQHLASFESFLTDNSLGTLDLLQQELTYLNHIPTDGASRSTLEIGDIFPDFQWRNPKRRFLGEIEGLNWQTGFRLPDRTGRLHVSIQTGTRQQNGQKLLRFDLTARGITPENSRDAMWKWFDNAHDWIVQGFADLTNLEVQKNVWGRQDG